MRFIVAIFLLVLFASCSSSRQSESDITVRSGKTEAGMTTGDQKELSFEEEVTRQEEILRRQKAEIERQKHELEDLKRQKYHIESMKRFEKK